MLLWNFNIVETFRTKPVLESLLNRIFPMNKKKFLNPINILAGQPLAKIFIVTMCTHTSD